MSLDIDQIIHDREMIRLNEKYEIERKINIEKSRLSIQAIEWKEHARRQVADKNTIVIENKTLREYIKSLEAHASFFYNKSGDKNEVFENLIENSPISSVRSSHS